MTTRMLCFSSIRINVCLTLPFRLKFLHVLHKLSMFTKFNLMVFNRYFSLRLKQSLREFEVLLLYLLDLPLAHDQVETLRAESGLRLTATDLMMVTNNCR